MENLPTWLGAVGALLVIAATLGAAVAVYKTNLQAASLAEARRVIGDLRGEISDYERQERRLVDDLERHKVMIRKLEDDRDTCARRITVLEDLLTKRVDDLEIRTGIAELKKTVDSEVRIRLARIETAVLAGQGKTIGGDPE